MASARRQGLRARDSEIPGEQPLRVQSAVGRPENRWGWGSLLEALTTQTLCDSCKTEGGEPEENVKLEAHHLPYLYKWIKPSITTANST